MLTAEEKIEELTSIINKMRNDFARGTPENQQINSE